MIVLASAVVCSVLSQEGSGVGNSNEIQLLRSMANLWTTKPLGNISDSGAVWTVSASRPGQLLIGFMNMRRDSSIYIHCITSQGDTNKYSVPTESSLIKLPIIAKIITATSSDSVIACFQKR
jgi:hypothetical protein